MLWFWRKKKRGLKNALFQPLFLVCFIDDIWYFEDDTLKKFHRGKAKGIESKNSDAFVLYINENNFITLPSGRRICEYVLGFRKA